MDSCAASVAQSERRRMEARRQGVDGWRGRTKRVDHQGRREGRTRRRASFRLGPAFRRHAHSLRRPESREDEMKRTSRACVSATLFAALLVVTNSTLAAEHAVQASLHIPPAETYVIGDTIPLFWRFENKSNVPLAFMWEGCCRLNGRLD